MPYASCLVHLASRLAARQAKDLLGPAVAAPEPEPEVLLLAEVMQQHSERCNWDYSHQPTYTGHLLVVQSRLSTSRGLVF